MLIPLTNSDFEKAREEIDKVLYNTRIALHKQEKDWRGWAVGKEVTEVAMKERITRALQRHEQKIRLILSVKTGRAADWEGIKKLIGARGGSANTQMENYASQYKALLIQMSKMPRDTWAQHIAICDFIVAEVAKPILTLWDE